MKKHEYSKERQDVGESIGVEWRFIYKNNPRIPNPRGLLLSKVADNAFDLKPFPANCRDQNPTYLLKLIGETIANSTLTPITVMYHSAHKLYYAGDGNHLQKASKIQEEKKLLVYVMVGDLILPEDVWRFFRYSYRINTKNMNSIEKAIAVELAHKHYGYKKHFRKDLSRDLMETEKDISSYLKIYDEMNKLPEVEKLKFIDEITRTGVGPDSTLNKIQNTIKTLNERNTEGNVTENKKNMEVYEQIDRRVNNFISKFSTSLKNLPNPFI